MKKKVLIVVLFVLFALPIPVAVVGAVISFAGFIGAAIHRSLIELAVALFGIIIGSTYLFTYISALTKTKKEGKVSAHTFLPAVHCLIAAVFLLMLPSISNYIDSRTEHFGFAKKDYSVVEELDTHGGFNGDGAYYLILDCSSNREKALKTAESWNRLPLSENLELMMYGGTKDGVTYGYELAKEAHMPEVENGYYMFEDRHSESTDSADDSALFDRYSYNFSIAVYDCDTDRMYYFEFDT